MVVFGTVFVFMDEIPELASSESQFHSPDRLKGTSITLHLQVPDAESVWRQALQAGAIPVIPLAEQFWGELYGELKDAFGRAWTIAQALNLPGSDEVRKPLPRFSTTSCYSEFSGEGDPSDRYEFGFEGFFE
jgi:hypothetical protein